MDAQVMASSASHVYVIGEATGFGTATMAMAQGRIAGYDAMDKQVPPFQFEHIVVGYETQPIVAGVGNFEAEGVQIIRAPYTSVWKIHEQEDKDGFVEIALVYSFKTVSRKALI